MAPETPEPPSWLHNKTVAWLLFVLGVALTMGNEHGLIPATGRWHEVITWVSIFLAASGLGGTTFVMGSGARKK